MHTYIHICVIVLGQVGAAIVGKAHSNETIIVKGMDKRT